MLHLNDFENPSRVKILLSVATFIYNEARAIFIAGTGEDEYGNEITNVVSEIETLPADTDGYRWANAASRLIRFIIHTLAAALQEQHQIDVENAQLMANIGSQLDSLFEDEGEE